MPDIEFSDRYGGHYPDPATVCSECDGMGCYPVYVAQGIDPPGSAKLRPIEDVTELERIDWHTSHARAGDHTCDGYHFIICRACRGTGKRTTPAPSGP